MVFITLEKKVLMPTPSIDNPEMTPNASDNVVKGLGFDTSLQPNAVIFCPDREYSRIFPRHIVLPEPVAVMTDWKSACAHYGFKPVPDYEKARHTYVIHGYTPDFQTLQRLRAPEPTAERPALQIPRLTMSALAGTERILSCATNVDLIVFRHGLVYRNLGVFEQYQEQEVGRSCKSYLGWAGEFFKEHPAGYEMQVEKCSPRKKSPWR